MAKTRIETFGCRLNSYESEVMQELCDAVGVQDTIIFNTCAVTAEAVRQARQAIRKKRRDNPGATLVVTGCAAQIDPMQFAGMKEVDKVIGNTEKLQSATYSKLRIVPTERVIVNDIMSVTKTASHMIAGFGSRTRAYVQIQNGCDHRCTFCIIPYGRGNSRSVAAGEVVHQIRKLTEEGYREIVLTGVDITSYGKDLPGDITLGQLVKKILKLIPALPRLRLSSVDSIEIDKDLLDVIGNEPRFMPHLHLSLQSGDNMILKRMKRRHNREQAIRFCALARELRPDIMFGADLIAGFPTETEAMFGRSMELVEQCDLTYLHVFPFSPRPGTPAERMPQTNRQTVKERSRRLRELGKRRISDHLSGQHGRIVELLMENDHRGRTPQFTEMKLDRSIAPGEIIEARVDGFENGILTGSLLPNAVAAQGRLI